MASHAPGSCVRLTASAISSGAPSRSSVSSKSRAMKRGASVSASIALHLSSALRWYRSATVTSRTFGFGSTSTSFGIRFRSTIRRLALVSKERLNSALSATRSRTSWPAPPGTNLASASTAPASSIWSTFSRVTESFFRKVVASTRRSTERRSRTRHRYAPTPRFFILRSTLGSSLRFSKVYRHTYRRRSCFRSATASRLSANERAPSGPSSSEPSSDPSSDPPAFSIIAFADATRSSVL